MKPVAAALVAMLVAGGAGAQAPVLDAPALGTAVRDPAPGIAQAADTRARDTQTKDTQTKDPQTRDSQARDTQAKDCIESAGAVAPDFALPHVARAVAAKRLYVAVVGSASSDLTGPRGTNIAYPAALEQALGSALNGVDVKVTTHARPRATAAELNEVLDGVVSGFKPALVIWQTGTADAIKGIDPDDFRAALDSGIDRVRAAQADVVFVNMQYSPRIEAMLAVSAYAETMRLVAVQRQAVLFDRFDIMKRWNEDGVFDLGGATRTTGIAEKVHGCLGRLLAAAVVEGARMASPP